MSRSLGSSSVVRCVWALAAVFLVSACAQIDEALDNLDLPPAVEAPAAPADETSRLRMLPIDHTELPGWAAEDHSAVLPTFLTSCARIEKKKDGPLGIDSRMGTVEQWREICKDARLIRPGNKVEAKYFFESRFIAYRVSDDGDETGLFTGYYEPELSGRWGREGAFNIPIYSRPKDLISADLGTHRKEFAGTQLAGRIDGGKFIPYFSRAEINGGILAGRELEIMWVDDAVEAFFLHIQGSGRVRMQDGSHVRIGYAGRNGRRYTSVGRELVGMGVMKLKDVTAPAIRDWMRRNPAAALDLMDRNESFVFFRVIEGDGPLGAQGVVLTPGRSLAVDRKYFPMGVPFWLNTTDPLFDDAPIRRLMVAQDTGSAIKGPVRGDVFWGFGEEAAARAGLMKQSGRYYLFLPRAAAIIPNT